MIKELHISNYALIDTLNIEFGPKLNIITGETGTGKSIILGAMSLLMGARADTRTIRDNSRKTVVEATFYVSGVDELNELLTANDIDTLDPEGTECILRREITVKGGSRAFVNDTPVTVGVLKQVSGLLVDIHAQHQNRLLSDPGYQLQLLDALSGNGQLLAEYKNLYSAYRKCLDKYTATRDMLNRNQAESEYIAFQLQQLDDLNVRVGEQAELERQRDIAANLAQIKGAITGAINSLSENPDTCSAMARASECLSQASEFYDRAEELAARLDSARLEVQDIVETLEDYNGTLGEDADLDAIEDRLGRIYSLETRLHADSDKELVELRDKLREQLETINNAEPVMEELALEARNAKKEAVLAARKLTEKRMDCARGLSEQLTERARPLALPNLKCELTVSQEKLSPTGQDSVELKVAFNKNQQPMAISGAASGGEISRLVLALKSIAVESMHMPTIIFDEVDTGVSGDTAVRMARLMHSLAQGQQVIVITHLPQVAAAADVHLKVYKRDTDTTTETSLVRLDDEGRAKEIALMLSGDGDAAPALETARALMASYPQE